MFRQILQKFPGFKADFLYLDGRILTEDLSLLPLLVNESTIVAVDDFEGIEKGVENLMVMRANQMFEKHYCIYPCSDALLRTYGLNDGSTTALLIPESMVRVTPQ